MSALRASLTGVRGVQRDILPDGRSARAVGKQAGELAPGGAGHASGKPVVSRSMRGCDAFYKHMSNALAMCRQAC